MKKLLLFVLFAPISLVCGADSDVQDALSDALRRYPPGDYHIFIPRVNSPRLRDYKGGVAAFEAEIAAHPTDARLLLGLGLLHYSFTKYTDAKAALERALILEPANAVAHHYLGLALSQEGRPAESLKHLDLAIKFNPHYGDAHFNRAVVLATANPPNKSAARSSYKQAISLGCEKDTALEQLLK